MCFPIIIPNDYPYGILVTSLIQPCSFREVGGIVGQIKTTPQRLTVKFAQDTVIA